MVGDLKNNIPEVSQPCGMAIVLHNASLLDYAPN